MGGRPALERDNKQSQSHPKKKTKIKKPNEKRKRMNQQRVFNGTLRDFAFAFAFAFAFVFLKVQI